MRKTTLAVLAVTMLAWWVGFAVGRASAATPRAVVQQADTGRGQLTGLPYWNPCCAHAPYSVTLDRGRCRPAYTPGRWHCTVVIRIRRPRDLAARCELVELVGRHGYRFRPRGQCDNGAVVLSNSTRGGRL